MADEGQIAGKLAVLVEASLKGFRQRLDQGVEAAAKGIVAKVGIDLSDTAEADLRTQLEKVVTTAAKNVTATIGVDVDAADVKAKVEAAAKSAVATATVNVNADTGSVIPETIAVALAAEKAAPTITLRTRVAGLGRSILDQVKGAASAGQSAIAGMFSGGGAAAGAASSGGGLGLRTLVRGTAIFGVVSLIQPAIGAIGQLIAGLTSIVGAAAPAVNTLAAIPITLGAIIQGAMAGKVAFQGVGDAMGLLAEQQAALARGEKLSTAQQEKLNDALSELSPSAVIAAKAMVGLRDGWVAVRREVQEALFSKIADQIEPLATKMLPLLERELSRTSATLGGYMRKAMLFLQTDKAQADIGKVMKNNNVIFGDFLNMMGSFGSAALDFGVGSRRFGRSVGGVMRDVGDWVQDKAKNGREMVVDPRSAGKRADGDDRPVKMISKLDLALRKASEVASQLWNILKQIGGGLAGLFRAATPAGERLLDTFEDIVTKWNEWVNSDEGQTFLTDFFDKAEKGFREISALARDTFQGMAKWAADPKIAGMIEQIRTELGPKLGELLQSIADISGEGTINFITELTELANNLTPALEPLAELVGFLTSALDGINSLAASNPEAAGTIAKVIGLLLAVKATKGIAKLTFKILGLGGLKTASGLLGGIFGAGGLLKGGKGTGKFSLGKLLGGGSSKYGKGVQPVFVTNPGFGKPGKGGGPVGVGVPDGDTPDKDGKPRRGKTLTNGLKNVGKIGGPLLLAAGAGIMVDRLINGPKASDGQWSRDRAAAQNAARTPQQNANNIASPARFIGPTASLEVVKKALESREQKAAQRSYFAGSAPIDSAPAHPVRVPAPGKGKSTGAVRDGVPFARGGVPVNVGDPKKIAAVKKQIDATAAAAKKVGQEFIAAGNKAGQMGTKSQKSAKQTTSSTKAIPARLKKVGDEYAALGRKAVKSGNQTAKGTKGIENAAKKAATGVKKAAKVASESFDDVPSKMRRAAAQAGKAAGQIEKNVKSKTRTLPGTVRKAMDGVVKAVSSKAGPAKAASSKVGNNVKAPLTQLRGPLNTAGVNAMAGFEAGIRAGGARAVAAAQSIAAQVAAVSNKQLDIRSPSRVFARIGKYTMEGLEQGLVKHGGRPVAAAITIARNLGFGVSHTLDQFAKDQEKKAGKRSGDGIIGKNLIAQLIPGAQWIVKEAEKEGEKATKQLSKAGKRRNRFKEALAEFLTGGFREAITSGSVKQVQKAFSKFYSKIEAKLPKTKAGKKRLKAIKAEFRDEMALLAENAAKRAKIAERIAKVQAKVEDLKERRDTMRESFKNAANETGDIRNIAAANGGFVSPARLIAQLKKKVAKAYEFKRLLADLRGKGLGEEAYQQLVDLGFDEGLPIARQLAKGDSAALQEITALQQELDGIAEKAADESSATFFDGGIKAGEAMIKKLKDDLGELTDLGKAMGKAFLSELQSVLGMDLGVKKGDNLDSATGGTGTGTGGGGDGGGAKHAWEPKGKKDRKCKRCGKARNTPIHNNRTDQTGGVFELSSGGTVSGFGVTARTAALNSLSASGSAARRGVEPGAAPSHAEAPLVGAMSFHGVPDRAAAADVMDQANFELKKLRAGTGGRRRGRSRR